MQILKNPSPHKLERFIAKNPLDDATILHWTGSMWGIGCRLSSEAGIERIRKLKGRPEKQGLIALIPEMSVLEPELYPSALKPLMEQYWPGNLSMVFPYKDEEFTGISVEGKVAFRVPSDPALRHLIHLMGEPIISTSVNMAGLMPEEDYKRIESNYKHWFDIALLPGGREMKAAKEHSTIVEYVRANEAKGNGISDELKCLREGSVPFYQVKQSFHLPLVMFVCTANICRSPIAEKLFRHMINQENLALATDSCGLISEGDPISNNSLTLLLERGIEEAMGHISKIQNREMINGSWLVLTMEERQRDHLRSMYPFASRKIWTLNEIVGEEGDVTDPIGTGQDNYRVTFGIIEDRLQRLLAMIKNNTLNYKDIA